MPRQIDSFYQRIAKKEKTDEEKAARQRELLEQAREYYGFNVDLRDQRFFFLL